VVVHPGKHTDLAAFRAAVHKAMADLGWTEPLWLETSLEDPGAGLARQAVSSGGDLVLASGGDGTVTACVDGVAGTGVPPGYCG
jgi:diacylglycerol kinase (ATP)